MPGDYDDVTATMKELTRRLDGDEAVLSIMGCIAAVGDEFTGGHANLVTEAGQKLYNKLKGGPVVKKGPIPNPWFVFNGHEDRGNKITSAYKKSRSLKNIGSSVGSVVGHVASSHTGGINVVNTVVHASATGTTAVHMLKIIAIANAYPQSKTIADWCKLILALKTSKLAIRGGLLAGGLIPGGGLPAAVIASIAKTGVKLTFTNAVYMAAAGIHWRAFQEQAISGGRGMGTGRKIGPGSQIFYEIFTKRGTTRLLGNYDIDGLIQEPGGWEALADKILLI